MNQRKKVEELAKSRGVSLAPSAGARPAPAPAPVPDSWFARNMPGVAQALADMKAQLPPDLWRDVIANLRKGAGYAIEASNGLAIGAPPMQVWERGKAAERDGFQVMRLSLRDVSTMGESDARTLLQLLEFGALPGLEDVPAALRTIARDTPQLIREFPELPWPSAVEG